MASDESLNASETANRYLYVQQKVLSTYTESLQSAMAPLDARYREALAKLTEIQQGYLQELVRRVASAYQSYAETVSAIPAGGATLEPTIEAYNALVARYGEYVDPARWVNITAPAQRKLDAALADAQHSENAAQDIQEAVTTYYTELNEALQHDPLVGDLSDAQSHFAAQMGEMQSEMERDWQNAIREVNDSLTLAATETAEAFDVKAALENYVAEVKAVGEAMADAYRYAAETATDMWEDEAGDATANMTATSPFGAAAQPAPAPVASAPDSSRAAAAMAVATPAMPRASWVNVPDPAPKEPEKPKKAAKTPAKADEKAASGGTRSKKSSTQTNPKSQAAKSSSSSKSSSDSTQKTDKTKDD